MLVGQLAILFAERHRRNTPVDNPQKSAVLSGPPPAGWNLMHHYTANMAKTGLLTFEV